MNRDGGPPPATSSLRGHRALVVPVMRCEPCGQDMPVDHACPAPDVRQLLRLAANTVHPSTGALATIRARTHPSAPESTSTSGPLPPAKRTPR